VGKVFVGKIPVGKIFLGQARPGLILAVVALSLVMSWQSGFAGEENTHPLCVPQKNESDPTCFVIFDASGKPPKGSASHVTERDGEFLAPTPPWPRPDKLAGRNGLTNRGNQDFDLYVAPQNRSRLVRMNVRY
jgi:hypothetical protein